MSTKTLTQVAIIREIGCLCEHIINVFCVAAIAAATAVVVLCVMYILYIHEYDQQKIRKMNMGGEGEQ